MARIPKGYWEERSTDLLKNIEQQTLFTINSLIQAYNKATDNINKEISKIFSNYGKETGLSREVLEKLLNTRETETHYKNLLKVIDNDITDDDIKKKLLAKYNAPAYAFRISRYQALQDTIDIELKKLANIEKEITKIRYVDTISEGYYRNIFNIQKGLGIGFNFTQLDKRMIDLLLNKKWYDKSNYSDRIWDNNEKLGNYLSTALLADNLTGKSIQKMSNELKEVMDIGLYSATRLVRTETNYFANQAEMLSYEELGIEEYQFIATLDKITCEHCAELDKKVFKVEEAKAGKNCPPIHPNDRCTTVAYFGDDNEDLERIARNPVTDKNYILKKNASYEEWSKRYIKNSVEKYHKMYINEGHDKSQYEEYLYRLIKSPYLPKNVEKFIDLKYNNKELYEQLKREYRTVGNIIKNSKDVTRDIDTYYDFRRNSIEISYHGIYDYHLRMFKNNGDRNYDLNKIIDVLSKKINYYDPDTDRDVRYYDRIVVITEKATKEIVSIRKGATKKTWIKI